MEFQTIVDTIIAWGGRITLFVGGFSMIATITPNKVDNKIAQFLMNAINWFGANFGKAKNG